MMRQLTIQIFIFYLLYIYFPEKQFIKFCNTSKFYFSCSIEIIHFKESQQCEKQNN